MIHFLIAVSSVIALASVLALIGCELYFSAQKIADALGIQEIRLARTNLKRAPKLNARPARGWQSNAPSLVRAAP